MASGAGRGWRPRALAPFSNNTPEAGAGRPGFLCFALAERLRLFDRVIGEIALEKRFELVMLELLRPEPWSLLQDHDGETGGRELFGHDSTGGTRADDYEIHGLSGGETGGGRALLA